jgi:quercetin dioxygenase-like cupin family protein
MSQETPPIPFISRLFVGPANEFETELVFAPKGAQSPREAHTYDEVLVVVAGRVQITFENLSAPEIHEANALITIPAGTTHQQTILEDDTKLVIIHPDRTK